MKDIGKLMYGWASDLFPINRSITGEGLRETLVYIQKHFLDLSIKEIKTGTDIFDWKVPNEWNLDEAYIEDENNNRIIDFAENNLHIMGYSIPVDCWLDLNALQPHLYSSEEQPDIIPYITSYYKERWGFCLAHNHRVKLKKGKYHVVIKSSLKPGFLNFGERLIKGKSSKEILLSTYICHPSMANNEISGPVVTMALMKHIENMKNRWFSYRIIFIPETIGAIAYLSINHKIMKQNTIAGFVLTCVGDNRTYSFMPSRLGGTLADNIANHILTHFYPETDKYSFLQRGSDERQFSSPLIDLPVVSLMRSKYATYPEYHTSDDNLDLISPEGLNGGFEINRMCIDALEINFCYMTTVFGEPKMDKRGLRDTIGAKSLQKKIIDIMNFLVYADGSDLLAISDRIGLNIFAANDIASLLLEQGLIKRIEKK